MVSKVRPRITHAAEAAAAILPGIPRRVRGKQECFCVLRLDTANRPIGRPMMVAMGSVNTVEVNPRDVFREAVRRNATSIIVAHNHPSGEVEPSANDRALTDRLQEGGKLLGIPMLDHIVLGASGSFYSMADHGDL